MRGTTWPFGLAVAALVLGALLVIPRKPPDLGVQPPRLRIRGSTLWERERFRAITIVKGYEFEDRHLFAKEDVERYATLVVADADAPAFHVLGASWGRAEAGIIWPRIYLGGTGPDGALAALPLFVGPRTIEEEILRMGATVTPADLWDAFSKGVLELRITVEDGGTRYRWGRWPLCEGAGPRWAGGDVTLDDGSHPPGLAESLAARFPTGYGPRALVLLEVGTGVRYVDLLRAVECARGSAEVLFMAWPIGQPELEILTLPQPRTPEEARLLGEDLDLTRRVIVHVTDEGRMLVKGTRLKPETVQLDGVEGVLLRPDENALWSRCVRLLRRAQAKRLAIDFAFGWEDPQIRWERVLHVPVARDGERLDLPPDATAGEAFRTVLGRLRQGATAFSFE